MQELKEELENLGLPTDGKKADLVERLYASETEESAAPGKPAAGPTDAADAAAEEAAAEAPAQSGPALPKVVNARQIVWNAPHKPVADEAPVAAAAAPAEEAAENGAKPDKEEEAKPRASGTADEAMAARAKRFGTGAQHQGLDNLVGKKADGPKATLRVDEDPEKMKARRDRFGPTPGQAKAEAAQQASERLKSREERFGTGSAPERAMEEKRKQRAERFKQGEAGCCL
eukprot:jgi/Astpho2/6605/fgenesh1_pg.00101_%23_16_t